jgi:hypothetical protein
VTDQNEIKDDGRTGFNLNAQKLHCLIVLDDAVGRLLSERAGDAFFRAFVVENRDSGEMMLNFRFRYTDHDSWFRVALDAEKQKLSVAERVEYLAAGIEHTILLGASVFTGGVAAPTEMVHRFCPPDPDNGEATLDWLIAQDLIEVKEIITPDGRSVPVGKGTDTVT